MGQVATLYRHRLIAQSTSATRYPAQSKLGRRLGITTKPGGGLYHVNGGRAEGNLFLIDECDSPYDSSGNFESVGSYLRNRKTVGKSGGERRLYRTARL